jgi:hypothetical protein
MRNMLGAITGGVALLGLILPSSSAQAVSGLADEVLAIETVWTSGVDQFEPVDRLHSPVKTTPLNLWVKIIGDESALARLSMGGRLPLQHIWFYYGTAEKISLDDTKATDEISLHVGQSGELLKKLELEVRRKGSFDWRTWSRKHNLRQGRWVVRLLYADGARVRCQPKGQPVIDDCLISIVVDR